MRKNGQWMQYGFECNGHTKTPTGIETGKHTSTEESGGEFNNPAVVLKGDGAGETETVKGPADMPVVDLVGSTG